MKLEDKRTLIEILLCTAQMVDSASRYWQATGTVAVVEFDEHHVAKPSNSAWNKVHRDAIGFDLNHGDKCIEAAYRLIESSPTLRREWFARGGR